MRICLMIEGQESVTWEEWLELAKGCEDSPIDALFRSDHYQSVMGQTERSSLDGWATICGLAAVTSTLRLGTLVSGTCPTACQQLAPDSPVLSRLDNEPLPTGVLGLSMWTTSDEVVQPPTSSVEDDVPSPAVQSVCAASQVNHGGLPNDRVVQAMVLEALGTGARGLRPAQLVTSRVVKFAQAASSSTPT